MLRQETLVKAVCDYCHTPATAPRDDGAVTLLFADETEAREQLGLNDGGPDRWRELDNGLLICPLCTRARNCVLGGGHYFTDWAMCGCGGRWENHLPAADGGGCGYETRTCPKCDTAENRLSAATRRAGTP